MMERLSERLLAENPREMIRLRLNRLRSVKLNEAILKEKNDKLDIPLDDSIIKKKAIGLSSAIDSGLGFWNNESDSLNARILSRYYALLQMTIAEQVSSVKNKDGLAEVQKHTEYGHGLGNIRDQSSDNYPFDQYVYILRSGHFYSYVKHLGYDSKIFDFEKRPKNIDSLPDEKKAHLVSIVDLFRRVPELQPVIQEYTGLEPLSFQVTLADFNYSQELRQRSPIEEAVKTSFLLIIPESDEVTLDYMHSLNLQVKNLTEEKDRFTKQKLFVGEYKHPSENHWWYYMDTHKSSHSGTSIVHPIFGECRDLIVIHFMLLYSLSILVRYLPDLWHEIINGKLDNIGSLIEYYLAMFDNVVPLMMLERITERKIYIDLPGGLHGRV